jgi:hypothetical protein
MNRKSYHYKSVVEKCEFACHYLPVTIYCNLYKYGLSITTGQGIFGSVLDSSNKRAEPFDDSAP